jgi:predicted permease
MRRQDFPNWPAGRRFHEELIRRASALPGVEYAAVAGDNPLAAGFTNSFVVVGREAEARNWPEISLRFVSADYARVTGQALLAGRHVSDGDGPDSIPVVVINREARRQFFPAQDPIGHQIEFWGARRTIVGVVADEKIHGLEKVAPPAAYVPVNQAPLAGTLLVRVAGDPVAVAPAIREIFRDLDPALAVFGVEPLRQTLAESLGERRFTMLLLGAFAAVTLLLAVLGVYGVLSYGVAQRRGEIGVRMALGARPSSVQRLVMGQGLALAGAGLALGIGGSLALTRLLRGLLFGVTPTDAATFVVAPLLLLLTAVVASYLPARRASRVDPVTVIRAE